MIEELLTRLTLALTGRPELALGAALGWGIASILLSPCHLSSIPLVVGYISADGVRTVWRTFMISLLFGVGILLSILIVGIVTGALGRMFGDLGLWGNVIVSSVFFVMGLALLDVLHIPWMNYSGDAMKRRGLVGALALGLIFGVGLGPCTFAFLAPILGLVFSGASEHPLFSVLLLSAFAIGHSGVIILAGTLTHFVTRYLAWTSAKPFALWLRRGAGVLVLLAGVYNIAIIF